ncbi:MAG: hypothetical protein ACTTKF_08480 [Bacteroides sp.]
MVKPWDMAHCAINAELLGDALLTHPHMAHRAIKTRALVICIYRTLRPLGCPPLGPPQPTALRIPKALFLDESKKNVFLK